jgi:hypothetical protein
MIPFHTLAERHLVYAYLAVALLQISYATYLAIQWRATRAFASRETPSPAPRARG